MTDKQAEQLKPGDFIYIGFVNKHGQARVFGTRFQKRHDSNHYEVGDGSMWHPNWMHWQIKDAESEAARLIHARAIRQ